MAQCSCTHVRWHCQLDAIIAISKIELSPTGGTQHLKCGLQIDRKHLLRFCVGCCFLATAVMSWVLRFKACMRCRITGQSSLVKECVSGDGQNPGFETGFEFELAQRSVGAGMTVMARR